MTEAEIRALIEAAREAHDWLLASPYKGKQGRGDHEMAEKLSEALEPFKEVKA